MNPVGRPPHHLAARQAGRLPVEIPTGKAGQAVAGQQEQNVPGQEGAGVPGYRGIGASGCHLVGYVLWHPAGSSSPLANYSGTFPF